MHAHSHAWPRPATNFQPPNVPSHRSVHRKNSETETCQKQKYLNPNAMDTFLRVWRARGRAVPLAIFRALVNAAAARYEARDQISAVRDAAPV